MRNTHVCVKNPFKIVMCKDHWLWIDREKKLNIWKEERKKEKRK